MNAEEKQINGYPFVRYRRDTIADADSVAHSAQFYHWMNERRTVRDFSSQPIPNDVICNLLRTAATAPSGAHKQPWTFCVVHDPALKREIRLAAEQEEKESYENRMNDEWLSDLKPLQTDWQKPFLETAPCLIVVFKKVYDRAPDGAKRTNYYVAESVGLACGFLLAAIHQAGLVALTHTPSPMNFLSRLLRRPENERPFLLIPVGHPAEETFVPKLTRKTLEEVAVFY